MKKKTKVKKAVALTYSEEMSAPKVVASGSGLVAENILAKAAEKILKQDNPSNERLEQLRQKALENTQLAFDLLKR